MIPKITVVNHRHTKKGEYIGRPNPLGNPFSHLKSSRAAVTVATREEAVKRYQEWLLYRIRVRDEKVVDELERLGAIALETGELTLRCWCAPASCHGDVVKEILEHAIRRRRSITK